MQLSCSFSSHSHAPVCILSLSSVFYCKLLDTILLRFRTYPISITADISKMYRAVELEKSNRDLHRFLWRANPEDPIQDFHMTRVMFGMSASPYLAVRALQQTASNFGHLHPTASSHVSQSFYIDDLLAGANTPEEALAPPPQRVFLLM